MKFHKTKTGKSEMNNLTKPELQEIKRCIKYMINGGTTPYSSLTMDINKKLQSLIDNYCEHEPSDGHFEQFRWQLCSKCGAQYK